MLVTPAENVVASLPGLAENPFIDSKIVATFGEHTTKFAPPLIVNW